MGIFDSHFIQHRNENSIYLKWGFVKACILIKFDEFFIQFFLFFYFFVETDKFDEFFHCTSIPYI